MNRNADVKEHILVCLSPSPSNSRVVAAAARMADAFGAALTAIYVKPSDHNTLSDEDRVRLQSNIRFAEENGASITTMVGDNISEVVAEYAHICGITKIVVGRSGIKRQHFLGKTPLTEQIILKAPDLDVYIIPDSVADLKVQKERIFTIEHVRPTLRDFVITFLILCVSTCLGLIFTQFGFSESNIITVFILGVLVISVFTVSPLFGALGSLASVLLFNWFFIDPKFSFHTYEAEYPVTFAIMLISSLITGTLANQIKRTAKLSAREVFRTKVLLDTNQLLQKADDPSEVFHLTARQMITLLSRDVAIYPRADGDRLGKSFVFPASPSPENTDNPDSNEKEIADWVFSHQLPAGFRMDEFSDASALYLPICLNGYCSGVIAIRLNRSPLEPFENSIVTSILGECALALESLRNAEEKRLASIMVRNEQMRSNLLRSISHDIRSPLTSISGNASNLLSHYHQLDDDTREQIFSDIYDDSEWLINLVENLLSISRIENGLMELHLSAEVMSDVIEEALRHIDRNASEHIITVKNPDDIFLVDMDARLIMQLIINLINNAIKNTPAGSEITIESRQSAGNALLTVSDNGPGIPDDIKPHIFEMFYTGQNKVADGRRGFGLGLALCKSIAESHHGSITLSDNVPSGCCFSVSLPMKEVHIDE